MSTIDAPQIVLCVDDDSFVLSTLSKVLAPEYAVETATSSAKALEALGRLGAIPVVISDMQMPEMSGAEFLRRVAETYRFTTRILLTGVSDMEAAVAAVNQGNLFRFLLKPCPVDQLRSSVEAGVNQHRLLVSEHDLLQRTLTGSIRALTEVLGACDPVSFGRIGRLKEIAVALAKHLQLADPWSIECAALMCQLGNVSLPDSTIKHLYSAQPPTIQEQMQLEKAAKLSPALIQHIPRLEPVVSILEQIASELKSNDPRMAMQAKILRLTLAYEAIERASKSRAAALQSLIGRRPEFDAAAVNALLCFLGAKAAHPASGVQARLERLVAGMKTAGEIRSSSGALIVPAAVELTEHLLARLQNFPAGSLPAEVMVESP